MYHIRMISLVTSHTFLEHRYTENLLLYWNQTSQQAEIEQMTTTLGFDKMCFKNCLQTIEKPIIKEQTERVLLNLILLVS